MAIFTSFAYFDKLWKLLAYDFLFISSIIIFLLKEFYSLKQDQKVFAYHCKFLLYTFIQLISIVFAINKFRFMRLLTFCSLHIKLFWVSVQNFKNEQYVDYLKKKKISFKLNILTCSDEAELKFKLIRKFLYLYYYAKY